MRILRVLVLAGRVLTLRPFGRNLLTNMGAVWLGMMTIIVGILASTEGLIWASIASDYVTTSGKGVVAGLVGTAVAMVIAIVDAGIVLLDMSTSPRLGQELETRTKLMAFKELLKAKKAYVGMLCRVGLAGMTIYVTAPMAADLLLAPDAHQKLMEEQSASINAKRSEIENDYAKKIEDGEKLVLTSQKALEREIAGRGKSGKYGDGKVAAQMRITLSQRMAALEGLREEEAKALHEFDNADAATRETKYGVTVKSLTVAERRRVVQDLIKDPAYRTVSLLAKLFLVVLFATMLILKLLQPRSIGIYLNDHLQSEWRDSYCPGKLDPYITDPEERSTGKSRMSPFRFEDWFYGTYVAQLNRDRREREEILENARATQALASVESEFITAVRKRDDVRAELNSTRDVATGLRIEQDAVSRDIAKQRALLDRLAQHIDEPASPPSVPSDVLRLKQQTAADRARAEDRILEMEATRAALSAKLEVQEHLIAELQEREKSWTDVVRQAEVRLAEIRRDRVEIVDTRLPRKRLRLVS